MAVGTEEGTNARQIGHEQEVDEVDVEGTPSDILQGASYPGHLGEILLIMTEIHKDDGQQDKLGQRQGKVRPLQTQGMPLEHIKSAEDDDDDDERIEPAGVHYPLGL